MLDFHMFGVKKKQKTSGQFRRNRSNVGLQSSRLDQKDPQDRRGYFCKIWASKTWKKLGQIFSSIFRNVPVDLAQNPLNPRTNGW